MILMSALCAAILLVWAGAGALSAGRLAHRLNMIEFLCLAFLAGAGIVGVWALLLMASGSSSWMATVPLVLLFSGILGAREWRRRLNAIRWPEVPTRSMLVVAILLSVAAVKTLAEAQFLPLSGWDSRIIWGFKAKAIGTEGTVLSPTFMDPYRIHLHPAYPMLVPIVQAYFASLGPAGDDRMYKAAVALFGLAGPLLVFGFLNRGAAPSTRGAAIGAVLLALLPLWVSGLEVSLPEILPACFNLAAAGLFMRWMSERDPCLHAWGLHFALLSALCKEEGLVFAVLFLAASAVRIAAVRDARGKPSPSDLLPVAFVAVGIGSWLGLSHHIPIVSTEDYAGILQGGDWTLTWGKVFLITREFVRALFNTSYWGLLPMLAILSTASLRATSPELRRWRYLTVLIGCYLLLFVPVFVLSPWVLLDRHIRLALPRIALQVAPIGCLVVGQAAGAWIEEWRERKKKSAGG